MRRTTLAAGVGTAALCLCFVASASAATLTVNTLAETGPTASDCGILDAITAANNNSTVKGCAGDAAGHDTIQFSPSLTLPGQVVINPTLPAITSDITITGPGADMLDLHVANACTCVVLTVSSGTVNLSGLELSGGNGFGSASGLSVGNSMTTGHVTADLLRIDHNDSTSPTPGVCGGGIVVTKTTGGTPSTLTLTRSTVDNNTAAQTGALSGASIGASGGGICSSGTLNLDQDTINANTATSSGAATNNSASGGGIMNFAGTLTLERTTMAGNTASVPAGSAGPTVGGGGLYQNFTAGSISNLTSVTFANNTSEIGTTLMGGPNLEVGGAGAITVRSTILALPNGDGAAGAVNCNSTGTLTSLGYNLESGASCGFGATGDKPSTLPLLTSLADHGGPTFTRSLQAMSPAIDAGNSFGETFDQRGAGFPRPLDDLTMADGLGDKADIGAVEVPGQAPPVPTPPSNATVATATTPPAVAPAKKKCKKKKHRAAATKKKCRKKKE